MRRPGTIYSRAAEELFHIAWLDSSHVEGCFMHPPCTVPRWALHDA